MKKLSKFVKNICSDILEVIKFLLFCGLVTIPILGTSFAIGFLEVNYFGIDKVEDSYIGTGFLSLFLVCAFIGLIYFIYSTIKIIVDWIKYNWDRS